jgi:hypothetical protein
MRSLFFSHHSRCDPFYNFCSRSSLNARRAPHKAGTRSYLRTHRFWRSVGLKILPALVSKFTRKVVVAEPPKPVVETSLPIALIRCSVHILPVFTSIVLITLNFKYLYLGRDIAGLIRSLALNNALLQIAAKMQELLVVASLTSVVITVLRHEMTNGGGIPLDFISGPFLFSNLSYLWSSEFWGASTAQIRLWTKCKLYGLLMLADACWDYSSNCRSSVCYLDDTSRAKLGCGRQQLLSSRLGK